MHHAYLLVGNPQETELRFSSFLEELGVSRVNNPDLFLFETEVFGVDDARKLSTLSARKAFGTKKIFLVRPTRFTQEAQNALLKTLEEPHLDTHVFLVAREKEILIPTLLSRMQVVEERTGLEMEGNVSEKYLGMPIKKKLEFAKNFADKGGNLAVFLDNILLYLRSKGRNLDFLKKIQDLRFLADGQSVSERLILEHLSFIIK